MGSLTPARWHVGAVLWAALAVPPVRHVLESTMTLQMLVQLPLLALAGALLVRVVPRRLARWSAPWNRGGVSGIVLASVAGLVWMLPRLLDAAPREPWVELAKFASVPLLIGMPLSASWPVAGFVARGLLLAESTATAFRLGWLYHASPVRLCSNYLLDDQQQVGNWLLLIGAASVAWLAWMLVFGHVRVADAPMDRGRAGPV